MKTAISIPDELFERGEQFAAQHGKSRSELLSDALREYLASHGDSAITAQLNEVYADLPEDPESQEWLDVVRRDAMKRQW